VEMVRPKKCKANGPHMSILDRAKEGKKAAKKNAVKFQVEKMYTCTIFLLFFLLLSSFFKI